MNLADIRKKSVANKKEETAVAVEQPEMAGELFDDQLQQEASRFHEPEHLAGEASEEVLTTCVVGVQVEEGEFASELVVEAAPEGLSEAVVTEFPLQTPALEPVSPPVAPVSPPDRASVPSSSGVKAAGYDPLTTIISGREWSADAEETSLYSALPSDSGELEEYLCFRVAHEEYAINILAIKEIIKPRDVTEVPRMPEFITGVISLRGVIIPIMDMRLRLALPAADRTGRERVVVIKQGSGFCGVLVDEVLQVARINKADIEAPPAVLDGIDRDFVKGLGRFDKRMLILLNLDKILDVSIN